MNAEPLDALDEEALVRMARHVAKGAILSGDQREIMFLADMLKLMAKRTILSIGHAQDNFEAQKN